MLDVARLTPPSAVMLYVARLASAVISLVSSLPVVSHFLRRRRRLRMDRLDARCAKAKQEHDERQRRAARSTEDVPTLIGEAVGEVGGAVVVAPGSRSQRHVPTATSQQEFLRRKSDSTASNHKHHSRHALYVV